MKFTWKLTIADARRARATYIKTLDNLALTAIKKQDPQVLFAIANEAEEVAEDLLAISARWEKATAERTNET